MVKKIFIFIILISTAGIAQENLSKIDIPLNEFVYNPAKDAYFWPDLSASILEITSHPYKPVFSQTSILFNLNSTVDGNTSLFHHSLKNYNVLIEMSVSIPFDPNVDKDKGGGYARVACSVNKGVPMNMTNGSTPSFLIEADSLGEGHLGCYLTWGYLASIRFTKITLTPKPLESELPVLDLTKSCKVKTHSHVNVDTLSLNESLPLTGVPFDLTYSSQRLRTNLPNSIKNLGLGGWFPSIWHMYDIQRKVFYSGSGESWPIEGVAKNGSYYISNPEGSEIYEFNSAGLLTQTKDALLGVVKYQFAYTDQGKISAIRDTFNNITSFVYDSNTITIISPYGKKNILHLDANGFVSDLVNPNNEIHRLTSSSTGLLTSVTKPMGQKSKVTYDAQDFVIKDEGAGGDFITFLRQFDANQGLQSVSVSNALGIKTEYQTQANSSSASERAVIHPSGEEFYFSNEEGKSNTFNNSLGAIRTTILAPDPRFGLMAPYNSESSYKINNTPIDLKVSLIKSVELSNTNDPLSLQKMTTIQMLQGDPTRTSQTIFQAAEKTMTTVSAMKRKGKIKFDLMGQVSEVQSGHLQPIKFFYDSRGRLSTVEQKNRKMSFFYDQEGYLSVQKDFAGLETKFQYDKVGRLVKQIRPDGKVVRFGYNKNGKLISLTPPERPEHGFSYNLMELVSEYLPPSLSSEPITKTTYSYDLAEKLTQINRPDGKKIKFNYHPISGLLESINTSQGSYIYKYKENTSLISEVETPRGIKSNYTYADDILMSESLSGNINSFLKYNFNSDGSWKSYTLGAQTIPMEYDKDSLLTKIGDLNTVRDDVGAIIQTKLGSVVGQFSYDDLGQVEKQKYTFNKNILAQELYRRDSLGRIIQRDYLSIRYNLQEKFDYDKQGRLIKVYSNNNLMREYKYDGNGNRIQTIEGGKVIIAQYDNQDRLFKYGNTEYQYSAHGNLKGKTESSSLSPLKQNSGNIKKTAYDYDEFGNLLSVKLPSGKNIEYLIDAQNRRVGKKINGKFFQGFIYKGQTQIIGELDGNGNLIKQFIYGSKMNVPDYMIYKNKKYQIISNQVGTPEIIVEASSGKIVAQLKFDEFGRDLNNQQDKWIPFGFAGGLYDSDTGLVRFGARDYDPTTGRWTSKDPIGLAGGLNLYAYVEGNPLSYIDPWGLKPGDIYSSQELAGIQAIKDINPTSIKEDYEYFGFVYKNGSGYSYTAPQKAPTKDGGNVSCPNGTIPNATYHTHGGAKKPGYEYFSPEDLSTAAKSGLNSYLGTPSGSIQVFLVDGELGIKILAPGVKSK